MKNKTLTLLAAAFLFTGCSSQNVSVAPAKFTLTVINHTDSPMKWAQTWAMTGGDSGVVAAGATVALSSNETGGDVITINPVPPKEIKQPNPQNGTFQMTYGWDGKIARVYADNIQNNGNHTKGSHSKECNWIYATKWLKPSGVQINTSNTVTFTTEPFSDTE
jgi:hypothetical protein